MGQKQGAAMRQLFFLLCLMLLSPQVASLGRYQSQEGRKRAKELPEAAVGAAGSRDFAFDLYRALVSSEPGWNVFFCPLSISMSLAMISLGARSHTKTEILQGLGLNLQETQEEALHRSFEKLLQELSQPRDSLQLSLGNALFVDSKLSIQDSFLSAAKTLYLADSFPSNFEDPKGAEKQINDYVAKQTKGRIVDLLKNLDSDSIMVLVNYIFLKAKWETSFDSKNTRKKNFHVSAQTVTQVPMMNHEDLYHYLQDRSLSCRVVAVPYQGNATAVFILPNEGSLEHVENGLNEKVLQKWLNMFRKRQLQLYLPKFSITGSYQLEKVLPKLGIREVFTSQADLSGITTQTNIQVSEMVHKAMVEVDESGTRAASATGTAFTFRSAQTSTPRLVFNRPFLMLVMEDNTKDILCVGKVTHP